MKTSNNIQKFFDKMAPTWDAHETETASSLKRFLSQFPLKAGDHCLDIACGTGVITPTLFAITKVQVRAIDLSSKMVALAKEKIPSNEAYITQEDFYNFKETGFDVAIIFNAYPHFIDVVALRDKLYEVLKQGGYFIIAHDIGLDDLEKCHEGLDDSLSRKLQKASIESQQFAMKFKITSAHDDKSSYVIVGQKI